VQCPEKGDGSKYPTWKRKNPKNHGCDRGKRDRKQPIGVNWGRGTLQRNGRIQKVSNERVEARKKSRVMRAEANSLSQLREVGHRERMHGHGNP